MDAPTGSKVIALAMERFRTVEDAEGEIRKRGLQCDKFYVGEQWDTVVAQQRQLQRKPCLTINRLPQFTRQVTNDMRMNRPQVRVIPVEDNDVEKAKILEGLVRHIQVNSNADVAYDTACQSQVGKGWGYFRVVTEYCDDNSFDQEIKIKRIKNTFSVYFDPACQEPDYSDGRYCFIVTDMPMKEFKQAYPKATASNLSLDATGNSQPQWMTSDYVRVAEYFEVVEEDTPLFLLSNGQTVMGKREDAEMAAMAAGLLIERERMVPVRKVLWRKINALEVLEGGEEGKLWPGKWIPVIPVLGEDMEVDGKRYLSGMVWGAMDPQRQYNFMSSAQTEAIALAPKAPFVGAVGQFENLENFWKAANSETFAYLPYNPVDINGTVLGAPQRVSAEPPVQAMVQATQKASDDLKAVTGIYDASLGARSNEQSGRAIVARQKEGDVSNYHYMDNLARSLNHLGRILIDLIPKIYDAPRILRIVGEDNTSESVYVNQPLDKNKKPLPPEAPEDAVASIFDLSTGKYDVTVEVGPSFSTKRQEAVESMATLTQAYPPLMQMAGDIMVKNMDWPQAQDVADRLKKMLPPQLQDDKNEEIPEQTKAQMAQMDMMIQQLTQALNVAQDELDKKEAEIASKERIAAQNNETKVVIAAMQQENSANLELMRAELGRIQAQLTHAQQLETAEHQVAIQPQETPVDAAS